MPVGEIIKHDLQRGASMFRILMVLFFFGAIGWFIYVGAVKPHFDPLQTTTQNADAIQNNYITESDDSFFIGMKLLGFKVGVSRPVKVKPPVIKQEVKDASDT